MKQKRVKKAVAVSYKSGVHDAPVIKAKGAGVVADSILKEALKHDVPIWEDHSLAEILSSIDLDRQIPPDLYQVVAEVLAFVYRMDQKGKPKG